MTAFWVVGGINVLYLDMLMGPRLQKPNQLWQAEAWETHRTL